MLSNNNNDVTASPTQQTRLNDVSSPTTGPSVSALETRLSSVENALLQQGVLLQKISEQLARATSAAAESAQSGTATSAVSTFVQAVPARGAGVPATAAVLYTPVATKTAAVGTPSERDAKLTRELDFGNVRDEGCAPTTEATSTASGESDRLAVQDASSVA